MVKKDLQLLHKNHLIEEADFKYLVNCFAQIDMVKMMIKQRAEKYKDILNKLKGKGDNNDTLQINEES